MLYIIVFAFFCEFSPIHCTLQIPSLEKLTSFTSWRFLHRKSMIWFDKIKFFQTYIFVCKFINSLYNFWLSCSAYQMFEEEDYFISVSSSCSIQFVLEKRPRHPFHYSTFVRTHPCSNYGHYLECTKEDVSLHELFLVKMLFRFLEMPSIHS